MVFQKSREIKSAFTLNIFGKCLPTTKIIKYFIPSKLYGVLCGKDILWES